MSVDESGSPGKWLIEHFTEYSVTCHAVKEVLKTVNTDYQHVEIVDTYLYGRCLFLDGKLQSSELDEFIYHESLVHPALLTHPNPKKILIVGGGEGATLREVLKHPTVEEVTMIDIDEELVKLCKEYLSDFSQGAFEDPKVKLIFADARKWLEQSSSKWDIIIIDLPEPLPDSPACFLYTREFYSTVHARLTDEGVMVVQAGTTHIGHTGLFASINRTLMETFPVVRAYNVFVPSYQLPWGFSLASKHWDPLSLDSTTLNQRFDERGLEGLRHYNVRYHYGIFSLPGYLEETIEKDGRVVLDDNPYYWEA